MWHIETFDHYLDYLNYSITRIETLMCYKEDPRQGKFVMPSPDKSWVYYDGEEIFQWVW